MSSKVKQILLWAVIITGALAFVYFLNSKQAAATKELSFDAALTRIKNKDVKQLSIKQDGLDLVTKNDEKYTAKLDCRARDRCRNKA